MGTTAAATMALPGEGVTAEAALAEDAEQRKRCPVKDTGNRDAPEGYPLCPVLGCPCILGRRLLVTGVVGGFA